MASKTFTDEELNYFRICYIVTRVVPEELRKFFKQEWDRYFKATHGEWRDTAANGSDFYNMESPRNRTRNARLLAVMANGITSEWECTCLFYALLYSDSLGRSLRHSPEWRSIDALREIRNKVFAHTLDGSLKEVDFQASVQNILTAFSTLKLDPSAVEEMKNQKSFETDELRNLQQELEAEKKRNAELFSFCVLPPKPSHDTTERLEEISSIYEEMTKLRNAKKNETTVSYLSGNPGCGKSEMARQIGQKYFKEEADEGADLRFVFTLNGFNLDTLLPSYVEFAGRLNCDQDCITSISTAEELKKDEKIAQIRALIATRIQSYSSWLIIVDNVVDLKSVFQYLPQAGERTVGKGQILVTTQDSKSITDNDSYTYHASLTQGMKQQDSIALLGQVSGLETEDEIMLKVARALDFQPLALACAAVYMQQICKTGKPITWGKYLQKLQNDQREATEAAYEETSLAYRSTMTAAVKFALEREVEKNEVMMHAFRFLSYVAPDPIPLKYVVEYVKNCMPEQDEDLLAAKIVSSSLVISSVDESKELRLHQVVYDCLQNVLGERNANKCDVFDVVLAFSDLCSFDKNRVADICESRKLVPHIKSIVATLQPFTEQEGPASSLKDTALCAKYALVTKTLSSIGQICKVHCCYQASLTCFQITLMLQQETVNDEKDLSLADIQHNIGLSYCRLGQYENAKLSLERVLNIYSHVYASDHHLRVVVTLTLLSFICKLYLAQHEVAEVYLKRAMDPLNSMVYGSNDIDTLSSLGKHLIQLGQNQGANLCIEKCLVIQERLHEKENPKIFRTLNNLAFALNKFGDHEKAKEYLERALTIQEKTFGDEHPDVASTLNNLGICLHRLQKYKEARECVERSLARTEKTVGPTHSLAGVSLSTLGLIMCDIGQHIEARTCYERALRIQKKVYGDEHPEVATTLTNLGICLHSLQKYEEAKECVERSLAMREKTLGPTHPVVAESLSTLGSILVDLGQHIEARTCYERALAILEKEYGDENPEVATTLRYLGICLHVLRKYKEAKECVERSLAIREKTLEQTHPLVAKSLSTLGSILHDMGQYSEAIACYERALTIEEKVYGDEHPAVATTLRELGICLHRLRKYKEAKECAERSLAIREKTLGPTHSLVAVSLSTLGLILCDMGQYSEARTCYERALTILEKVHGDEHPEVATTLINMGICLSHLRKYKKAKECVERSLAIREKALGPTHSLVAKSLSTLGDLLLDMGQYSEARTCYERALTIREKEYGDEHPKVATTLINLGVCLRHLQKHKEAKECVERSLAIREKTLGPTHSLVAKSLSTLGSILFDMGQHSEARTCYERALTIREKEYGDEHPEVATTLRNLGSCLRRLRKYKEAKECVERSLAIREKTLGPTHPLVAESLSTLGRILHDMGQYSEAITCSERALNVLGTNPLDHNLHAKTLNSLGCSLLSLGRVRESSECFERALSILTQLYDEGHPGLMTIRKSLQTAREKEEELRGAEKMSLKRRNAIATYTCIRSHSDQSTNDDPPSEHVRSKKMRRM